MDQLPLRPPRVMELYDAELWEHVGVDRMHLQRCAECSAYRFPPSSHCDQCLSGDYAWAPIRGVGTVVAWTTLHRGYFAELPPPYTIVVAELAEGPLLVADLAEVESAGDAAARLWLDAPVELVFRAVRFADDPQNPRTLYSWRLADDAADTGDPTG